MQEIFLEIFIEKGSYRCNPDWIKTRAIIIFLHFLRR